MASPVYYRNSSHIDINQKRKGGLTPLHLAIQRNSRSEVDTLLKQGGNPLALTDGGDSCLHLCLKEGRIDLAIHLLYTLEGETVTNLAGLKNKAGYSPLYLAAKAGETALVKAILLRGNPEMKGETALHAAAEAGHAEIVYLLCTTPGIEVDRLNGEGYSALFLAVKNKRRDAVSAMMSFSRASIFLQNGKEGTTAFHEAARLGEEYILQQFCGRTGLVDIKDKKEFTPLAVAVIHRHERVVKLLVAAGAKLDAANGPTGETALHLAALNGNVAMIGFLCRIPGIQLEARNKAYFTPLGCAIENGHIPAIDALKSAGADLYASCGLDGHSPLHRAAFLGRAEIITLLCQKYGVPVDSKAKVRKELCVDSAGPSFSEVQKKYKEMGIKIDGNDTEFTPLYLAAERGHTEAVDALLKAGADVNATNGPFKNTALTIAVARNLVRTVERLCRAPNIKLDYETVEEYSAPMMAIAEEFLDVLDLLLKAGADVNYYTPRNKRSLLHHAVGVHSLPIVRRLLLDRRITLNPRDIVNYTPLYYAVEEGLVDIVEALLSGGADPNETFDRQAYTVLHFAVLKDSLPVVMKLCSDTRTIIHKKGADQRTALDIAKSLKRTSIETYLRQKMASDFKKAVDLGDAAIRSQDYETAKKHFQGAKDLDPTHPIPDLGLGIVAEKQGDPTAAKKHFLFHLQFIPRSERALIGLGKIASDLKEYAAAHQYFERALAIDSKSLHALWGMGSVAEHQKNIDLAVQCFEKIIGIDPNHSYSYYRLAQLAEAKGEKEKAKDYFTKGVICSAQNFGDNFEIHISSVDLNPKKK